MIKNTLFGVLWQLYELPDVCGLFIESEDLPVSQITRSNYNKNTIKNIQIFIYKLN